MSPISTVGIAGTGLIGAGWAVERFAVPTDSFGGQVISDHFPVVADLVPDDR